MSLKNCRFWPCQVGTKNIFTLRFIPVMAACGDVSGEYSAALNRLDLPLGASCSIQVRIAIAG